MSSGFRQGPSRSMMLVIVTSPMLSVCICCTLPVLAQRGSDGHDRKGRAGHWKIGSPLRSGLVPKRSTGVAQRPRPGARRAEPGWAPTPEHKGRSTISGLLENHIAAVTGAGSGIGRAIAFGYAKAGAAVVALDANAETAEQTAAAIKSDGGRAWSFALDVRDSAACLSLAAAVGASVGRVCVLVNNAGINRRNAFTGEPAAVVKDWHDIMAVNLNGMFNVTHAFLEDLRQRRGRIINIVRSSPSCTCARQTRPPTPPPSTGYWASPARSPPSSARRVCASMPLVRG